MTQHAITRLLVVADGNEVANLLISNLRNAGLALRAASAASEQELCSLLAQSQWDVVVCYENSRFSPAQLLALLVRYEQDLPVILVTPSEAIPASRSLLKSGLRDVVPLEQSSQLLLSVQREAAHCLLRRQHRQLEMQYRELEKRHQLVLEGSATAISYLQDGVHLYCNQSYADSFGYDDVAAISTTPFLNLLAPGERPRIRTLLTQPLADEKAETVVIRRQDGSEDTMLLSFAPVEYHGSSCLQISVRPASGNSEYKASVALIDSQDLLTRLDNRTHFITRIENAIRKAVQQGVCSSLLIVKVNEFVDISSAIGKSSANIVLNDIAHFLQEVIGKPYAAARLEEHTFGIILYDGDPDAALALGSVIQGKINNRISPAMLTSLELSCSIGMALINGHALDAEDVLGRARNNLSEAPLSAGGNYQFQIGENLQHDAGDMLAYLKTALQQGKFNLLYQPLVHIKGESHKRYEVLVRMLDNEGNAVNPGAFLPLANLNGMGESIDTLVVSMALDSARDGSQSQRLIINITSNTLASRTFLPWLSGKLRQSRIPADCLVLQLSEIDIHNSPAQALAFCRGLQELNIRMAISHFGCALDPFAILDELRPEFVKLDETLVRDIIYSSHQKSSVQKLIGKLHARGLLVVVPQVEDMDVLPVLWDTGADYVQGYCLQAPSPEMNYEFVLVEEITLSAVQN